VREAAPTDGVREVVPANQPTPSRRTSIRPAGDGQSLTLG
jgi:hypothetical protein